MNSTPPSRPVPAAALHLTPRDLQYVLEHGRQIERQGCEYTILAETDIPFADRQKKLARRLIGTVIVASSSGCILQVYKGAKTPLRSKQHLPQRHRPPKLISMSPEQNGMA